MDVLVFIPSVLVFIFGLAFLGNKLRKTKELEFALTPNQLLTRYPLVFLTGPRSIFYFTSYWNLYPVYLAEHGFEVFHLNLPWRKTHDRQLKLREFIKLHTDSGKKFHLVMDARTFAELETIFRQEKPEFIRSLTILTDELRSHSVMRSHSAMGAHSASTRSLQAFPIPKEDLELNMSARIPFHLRISYALHTWSFSQFTFNSRYKLSSPHTLGAVTATVMKNCELLLERTKTLAEIDLQTE